MDSLKTENSCLMTYYIGRNNLYINEKGLLCRNSTAAEHIKQIVVPKALQTYIMDRYHSCLIMGHLGIVKTYSRIKLKYYWPNMHEDTIKFIARCNECMQRKSPIKRKHDMGHVTVTRRFERVAMDILDVTNLSVNGNRYILLIVDYFTKYAVACSLKNKNAISVADALMEAWILKFGFPLSVHSDQGGEFDNKLMEKLATCGGFAKTRTTPYHPQSDGMVERLNRTLLAMLSMFVCDKRDNWDDILTYVKFAYNTSVHKSTGYTPQRLIVGDESNTPLDLVHHEQISGGCLTPLGYTGLC